MQKQSRIIAIAGMLVIIAGIAVATNLEQVQAQNIGSPADGTQLSPKSYGQATAGIVCGDRLCSEFVSGFDIEEDTPIDSLIGDDSSAPTAELISIQRYGTGSPGSEFTGISYKITFSVRAGDTNLRDILIHGQTDLRDYDYTISNLNAFSSSVNVLRVHAMDVDSITGEIVGYSLTGPTGGPPR